MFEKWMLQVTLPSFPFSALYLLPYQHHTSNRSRGQECMLCYQRTWSNVKGSGFFLNPSSVARFSMFTRVKSSHHRCSIKKDDLKIFTKFLGKHLYWSILLKETPLQVFSWEFCEICKNTFFIEQIRATAFEGSWLRLWIFHCLNSPLTDSRCRFLIHDTLRDLLRFLQFKKREKHPWKCYF